MNNPYMQYQNDVNNTASNIITQMVCAEKGLDYNQVRQLAQQSHINGILQQEQERQFNQVLNRHYGGNTFMGKLKEVFGGGSTNFLSPMGMVGMPQMPMSPMPAMLPQVSMQMNPAQAAGVISQNMNPPVSSPDTEQLKKDVEDLKALLHQVIQSQQQQPVYPNYGQQP